MKKMKRYADEGYVTSDDSNAGMKEARDAIDADIARTPSSDYGDYMPESSSQTIAAPKPKPKVMAKTAPKTSNYSNEGRSTPAPAAKRDVTKMSLAERGKEDRETAIEKYGQLNKDIEARKQSSITNPSLLSRLFNVGSQRDRKYKSEKMASGGMASSASKRADGIASRGKTRGKMC